MSENIYNYRRNCTLVAAKIITNKSCDEIMKAARAVGYKNDHGLYDDQWMRMYVALGAKLGPTKHSWDFRPPSVGDSWIKYAGITVNSMLKLLKKGTYLVTTTGHIFVVRDGQLVDPNYNRKPALGRHVTKVIEVLNPHVPEVKGILRLARPNNRQRGTRAWFAYRQMANILGSGKFTKQQLLDRCASEVAYGDNGQPIGIRYNATDLAWDIKRGNVVVE